ncbi:MAG TPA: hypothetical protein VFX59_17370 [Polyangiales bacterium]|nr:hypothetical protein [Polyangiales bacterium]
MTNSKFVALVLTLLLLESGCDQDDQGTRATSIDGGTLVEQPTAGDAVRDGGALAPADRGIDASVAAVGGELVTVSLQTSTGVGVGGSFALAFSPVFLLSDGTATTDDQYSARGLSPEQHRERYPESWTHWTEKDGELSVEGKQGAPIKLYGRYGPMPAGFSLSGTYSYSSGGGTTAYGGDILITAQQTLQFFDDGRFVTGGFSGVAVGQMITVDIPPEQRGRYTIEGFRLTLRFDAGSERVSSIVVSDERPVKVFWLGAQAYLTKSKS